MAQDLLQATLPPSYTVAGCSGEAAEGRGHRISCRPLYRHHILWQVVLERQQKVEGTGSLAGHSTAIIYCGRLFWRGSRR
nr:hypothetical protein BgiMline_027098 [Biomphalaria glabrata]